MSKKLIAIAAAAALGLSALVAAPAQASTLTFAVKNNTTEISAANTAKTAVTHAAPEFNQLTWSDTATTLRPTNTTVRITVGGAVGQSAVVSSAGGVLVLDDINDASGNPLKVGAGSTSLSASFTTGVTSYVFYAYSTSTTPGTVSISSAGNTTVFHIGSRAGTAYNITSTEYPTSVIADGATKHNVYVKISDVFGNAINNDNKGDLTAVTVADASRIAFTQTTGRMSLSAIGVTNAAAVNTWTWDATKTAWKSGDLTTSTSGSVAFRVDLLTVDHKVGLAAPKNVAFSTLTSGSLEEQVAALTTQVAALQVIVDRKVSKKRYNTLARKWNRANPSDRVALKK